MIKLPQDEKHMIAAMKCEDEKRREHIEQGKRLVRELERQERMENVKKLLAGRDVRGS